MKNLSHYIGEEAIKHYKKIENETYFSPEKVKSINKQVYDMYREKMKHDFQLDDYNNKPYSVHGFSFDLNLLTFYVKYYKMDDYLNKAKDFILGKKNTIDYMLLSYYFLNLKSDNTNQKKLWSRIALSSDRNYYKNKKYIGIYYDTSLKVEYEKNFTNFLSEFLRQFKKKHGINYYYFRLGNKSHIIDDREREQSEFAQNITNYNYTSNSTDIENITEGISKFEKVFNTPIKEINKYYQNHLIIFVNNISNVNGIINTDIFTNNGIQVILFVKITDKNDLNLIKAKFNDKFNVITFHEYKNLNDYIYILKNAIIFNVQNFYYTNKIQLKNINTDTSSDRDSDDTYRKNILYNLKITFNEKLLSNNRAEDYNYFHIQLIYDGNNKVYNNNINMTFLVSQENPFPDITNYDIPNFCLNNSVPKENNPYINYSLKKYNTSNYSENFGTDQEQINLRTSMKEMNKLKLNKNSNVKNNSKYNLSNKSTSSISYYNYCNDLYNKSKNNYSTKITLNKMKIYKLNNSLNLTLNSDSRINKYFKQPQKGIKQGIKEEMNLEMNVIPNTTKTTRKKFSFNKTKKLSKKNSEKNFREMYLREGTVKNEESNSNNNNSSTFNNDNNEVKLFSYNDIILLKHKTYLSKNNNNGNNNNDELNNKNNNNNEHNLSLSPNLLPSNYPNKIIHNGNNTLEDQINLSQSINNIQILNPNSNEQVDEINTIYKKHWNEGHKRYKQLIGNKENEENLLSNLSNNLLKLNFCMANELFEIIVNKEELMGDIKNKFLELFFEKKNYGDTEKKYIFENILFLKEEGVIDINKNIKDNNLVNNEIIIPVLKDVTS